MGNSMRSAALSIIEVIDGQAKSATVPAISRIASIKALG